MYERDESNGSHNPSTAQTHYLLLLPIAIRIEIFTGLTTSSPNLPSTRDHRLAAAWAEDDGSPYARICDWLRKVEYNPSDVEAHARGSLGRQRAERETLADQWSSEQ
ncbi:hypothetical protein H2248_008088 [Termitomyces sp. 'cryptogamus']|nr:hypothetical protein H2248_008088 [Termitomyces sp. 'cryptogamus']